MSLSSFILAIVALHLGIVGIVVVVKSLVDQRNEESPYQLRLDVPTSGNVFIEYPNYSVNEGSPVGDAIGPE